MSDRRLSLRAKLLGAFAAVLVLTAAVGLVSLSKMRTLQDSTQNVSTFVLPGVVAVAEVGRDMEQYRKNQFAHIGSDAAGQTRLERDMKALDAAMTDHFEVYGPLAADAADRRTLQRVAADWRRYVRQTAGLVAASRRGDVNGAVTVLQGNGMTELFMSLESRTAKWMAFNTAFADDAYEASRATYASARNLVIAIVAVAIALGLGIALLLTSRIRRGVADVLAGVSTLRAEDVAGTRRGMEAMAQGDLTVDVVARTPPLERADADEIGDIARAVEAMRQDTVAMVGAYNDTRGALGAMIGRVTDTASTISSASQQMATSSEETGRAVGEIAEAVRSVAEGTERQVRSVEEAKIATEDVGQATQTSARSAHEPAEAAERARRVAHEGEQAVAQATEAMRQVHDSSAQVTQAMGRLDSKSEEIGGIVETITGIAGQTNLLALNAAIEAARAGDHGRGFAVVADEVRKLAEESQQAAASISTLVGEIQAETAEAVTVVAQTAARTEDGAATVEQARDAFARIGASVEDMTGRVDAIAAAVAQIAASAQKVESDMTEVAAVAEESSASTEQVSASTQQTSASAQEIACSAQQLATTAAELEELVSRFRVSAG
ncbi:MAG: methyl-accepting chemotaxis protein [Solirubrobacteraceae bacterium]|nr:methyl-accepting chemotaxis protein [Solirubrobacteraceae bacterium]